MHLVVKLYARYTFSSMISRQHYKNILWIDLVRPTKEEISSLMKEFRIDRRIADDLATPTFKPRVEVFDNAMYLVLHFPVFKHSHGDEHEQEIDFILGKHFVITSRRDASDAIHRVSKILESEEITDKEKVSDPTGFVFFRILKELYASLHSELDYINDWTSDIEKKIFAGKEREMVITLSQVSRVLLDFKRAIAAHGEVFESLKIVGDKMFGEHFVYHTQSILSDYYKLRHTIDVAKDTVSELRETNNSLLSTKQNETAKVIAVLAFIAVPLSLLISIFQIDSAARPIIGLKYDFWILVGFVLVVGSAMFAFFKYKKWL